MCKNKKAPLCGAFFVSCLNFYNIRFNSRRKRGKIKKSKLFLHSVLAVFDKAEKARGEKRVAPRKPLGGEGELLGLDGLVFGKAPCPEFILLHKGVGAFKGARFLYAESIHIVFRRKTVYNS